MARVVTMRILPRGGGRYAVEARLHPGGSFVREGLRSRVEARRACEALGEIMAACGVPTAPPRPAAIGDGGSGRH